MTLGFLAIAPMAIGWLVIRGSAEDDRKHWLRWILLPWAPILLGTGTLYVLKVEGAICILFALPVMLPLSSAGGVIAGLLSLSRLLGERSVSVCFALLPLLLSATESRFNAPQELRTVNTQVLIHAPQATVWRNVERVPVISHDELRPAWTHLIGFPRPIEATLDHEGIGGVRHASFEHGLLFVETIDEWLPEQRLGFRIKADTEHIPPTTLDEHVTIGGRYFDVLDGEYRLEPLANGDVLLHLSSRERLSTDFNAYAAFWSDAVMRDLQESILEVVKARCERASQPSPSATLNP